MPTTSPSHQYELVSQLAYQLWEQEGRPTDRAETHWLQAEAIISSENIAKKPAKKPSTRGKTRKV